MRLNGRRNSNNVVDKRGLSGKAVGIGGGIVGVIIAAVITLLSGGDLSQVAGNAIGALSGGGETQQAAPQLDAEEQQLYDLASKVLAGTEDVWTDIFRQKGWGEYRPPKMVIYSGSVQTGCGQGNAQVGPFYCSADQTVYQYLLGTLDDAHSRMAQVSEREANQISVRLELQADYYAGVWGHNDNRMFNSIEPGDVEEAVNAASKIGDDYLQKKAYGREMPESFNHGRSDWRVRWLTRGLEWGDPSRGDTFSIPYSSL